MTRQLFYFGCIGGKGHFIWKTETWNHHAEQLAAEMPGLNPNVLRVLDGTFTPAGTNEKQGEYNESIVPPVRIVAWWDRSVDQRPASNSAFVGYGYDSAEQMLDAALVKFPSVMKRQPRPVPSGSKVTCPKCLQTDKVIKSATTDHPGAFFCMRCSHEFCA